MADSVVRYLVLNHEIPSTGSTWLAPATPLYKRPMLMMPKPKHVSGGRVEISLLKNDLEHACGLIFIRPGSCDPGSAGTLRNN